MNAINAAAELGTLQSYIPRQDTSYSRCHPLSPAPPSVTGEPIPRHHLPQPHRPLPIIQTPPHPLPVPDLLPARRRPFRTVETGGLRVD
jgi:hypothetical protein